MRRASSSPQAAGAGHRAGGHWAQSPAPGPWRRDSERQCIGDTGRWRMCWTLCLWPGSDPVSRQDTPWTTAALGLQAGGAEPGGEGAIAPALSVAWLLAAQEPPLGSQEPGKNLHVWSGSRLGGPSELCPEVWGRRGKREAHQAGAVAVGAPPVGPPSARLPPPAAGQRPTASQRRSPRPLYR